MPDEMREQEIGAVGNEAGASVQTSGEIYELRPPKRRGLAAEGLIVDLVVKPVQALLISVLPPEMREALGIREPLKQEKKPPVIIVVNPGKTPETTSTGAAGTLRQQVAPQIEDRHSVTVRHLTSTGAGASVHLPSQ